MIVDRQIGHTTRQMLNAPIGAVFVWCNNALAYPKALAHGLQRDDLVVSPLSWLQLDNVVGRDLPGVAVDHAAHLDTGAYWALEALRSRGVFVAW